MSQSTLEVDSTKLLDALKKAPGEVEKRLRIALSIGLRTVVQDARANHDFKTVRGGVERSLRYEVSNNGLSGEAFVDEGVAKHAVYLHEGTGKYGKGHGAYEITPKNKKALYVVSGGQKWFSKKVTHPGIRPDPFLYKAFERQKSKIVENIREAVRKVFIRAGGV